MFVCLAVLAVIPVSTLTILPRRLSALVLLATAATAGPAVAAYVASSGASHAPELAVAAVTLAAGGGALALAAYLALWRRLEDSFDAWPWAAEQQRRLAAKDGLVCPFTGALSTSALDKWSSAAAVSLPASSSAAARGLRCKQGSTKPTEHRRARAAVQAQSRSYAAPHAAAWRPWRASTAAMRRALSASSWARACWRGRARQRRLNRFHAILHTKGSSGSASADVCFQRHIVSSPTVAMRPLLKRTCKMTQKQQYCIIVTHHSAVNGCSWWKQWRRGAGWTPCSACAAASWGACDRRLLRGCTIAGTQVVIVGCADAASVHDAAGCSRGGGAAQAGPVHTLLHNEPRHASPTLACWPLMASQGWPAAWRPQVVNTAAARRELDTALDLRGNFVWCALSACCAGCAAWQRTCALLPRLAAMLAAGAACAACAPWAFTRSLAALGRYAGVHRSQEAARGHVQAIIQCASVDERQRGLCALLPRLAGVLTASRCAQPAHLRAADSAGALRGIA